MKKLKLQRNPEPFVSQMVKNMEFNGSNMAPLAITYCISDILNICVGKQLNKEDSTSDYALRLQAYNIKY